MSRTHLNTLSPDQVYQLIYGRPAPSTRQTGAASHADAASVIDAATAMAAANDALREQLAALPDSLVSLLQIEVQREFNRRGLHHRR
jgi:hypothetical protein